MFELNEKNQHGLPAAPDYNVEGVGNTEAIAWQQLTEHIRTALAQGDQLLAGKMFEDLQARSGSLLLVIASRSLTAEDAEDIVATAYLDFYYHLQAGKAVTNTKALLSKIVRNLIVDHYRGKYVKHESLQEDGFWQDHAKQSNKEVDTHSGIVADPVEIIANLDFDRHMNAVMTDLKDHYRQVLEARIYDELSVLDTAERLGLTVDQVKKYTGMGLKAARRIAKRRGLYDGI